MKNMLQKMTLAGLVLALVLFANQTFAQGAEKHQDKSFTQDFSIKYNLADKSIKLSQVVSDRNGYIQILSSKGLMRTRDGQFLYPGTLVTDRQDRPTSDKKIAGIGTYQNQLVYIDDKAVLSNAWAGKLFSRHTLPGARIFAGGKDFSFLISDGKTLNLLKDSKTLWEGALSGEAVKDIKFDATNNLFWILGSTSVWALSPDNKSLAKVKEGNNITCVAPAAGKLIVGTSNGYFEIDGKTKQQIGGIHQKMPWTEITSVSEIDGQIWFGSTWGAMNLRKDGTFNYYASQRWVPSDTIVTIAKGPENSVLILTNNGLGKICFNAMTLYDKAMFFEKQVRDRHIRVGFNATVSGMTDGDVTSGSLENSDNDGLWTSMYLAGETFRYAVTKSDEALQNVRESLDALERLYTINPLHSGFPSRSFERSGYNNNSIPWRPTEDPEWDWKSTTSSDEAIGHIFAFAAIAELVPEAELRNKSIMLIDTLMAHVVRNNLYMIDWNGKPTQWGKWNPEYVNARPKMVGDRKINSSNIIGMLQTAWHFTKKAKYKEAAFNLMTKYGYLENLMKPMKEVGSAPEDADMLSRELSDGWNHSDDEMYYCGYWGLYRYAFNDTLKAKYKAAIIDHWEIERPEKEGLWNIMTALVDAKNIDLKEAIWYLQEYPLDLVSWTIEADHRKDIEKIAPNFRKQTIKEVLPPDELRISRHNANRFDLNERGAGYSEYSAGDIWLLPYWMGRYLNLISAPEKKN
jgi:hypothetical protein